MNLIEKQKEVNEACGFETGNLMRDLKFRVWDKELKKWKYFDLMELVKGDASQIWHYLNNDTWQQSTGLKDEYGNEIFIGDIVQGLFAKRVDVVKFENGAFTWKGEPIGWYADDTDEMHKSDTTSWAEIIGNIHENPEMIKELNK